jgi:hypothetical protein
MTVTGTSLQNGWLELRPLFSAVGESQLWPDWRGLPYGLERTGVVEIRRPDGTRAELEYSVLEAHYNWGGASDNPPWVAIITLKDCDEVAVPLGSEMWLDLTGSD